MHDADAKAQLRDSITQRMQRLTDAQKAAESRTLCRELLPHIPKGSTVCAYYPMKSEADIRMLLDELLLRGDNVFLPCFENNRLIFRKIEDFADLHKGALGVLEPKQNAKELEKETADIILVPGRAFDYAGNRMGRGNGGYDRWIAKHRKAHANTKCIGVALECQIVGSVPTESHDEPMDAIVTARGYKETMPRE
ncbi:5-formyltetrahydrofolate cyclo-ligase [Candidatus Peregrinibacteria bacterium CG10_big_fil_rev_8_21_14_0_10_49_24]|nr:MAG: 5-formyltetrahydrofolate cyclo-ligase [Candidatus Peregrinibacteria bacterium CG11_big_fil_rev_8_21_14_0_20_49_14]PIR51230.1 MAG: 5-formyltetrahydrofolate cyclo-ligase [Candidatus Peregrinibacteria bacterium CG10_big_fil_rev_8_21_14_0_10_49_24]PJA67268.1 MAG: 5-formyltetrahydrofolate cyclo-ligase [Candidatus Peregrinibacteria bacterium CG_4_9_14_3_um_filter_49_12]